MALKKYKNKPQAVKADKADKKEGFDPFQHHYTTDSPKLDKYIQELVFILEFKRPKSKPAILKVLFVNLLYSRKNRVGIYRTTSYKLPKRHNPESIGQTSLCTVLDALVKHGYIDEVKGDYSTQTMTIISRTSKLSTGFRVNEIGAGWDLLRGTPLITRADPVVLKNKKDKKVIDYEDTDYTNEVRAFLSQYEALLDEVCDEIYPDLDHDDYRFDQGYIESPFNIKRTFNWGKFTMGGRISAKWTGISKEVRPFLMIADEATDEIDMECSSINIMYRKATGKPYQGANDAYYIEMNGEVIPRKLVKQYLTIAQNTSPHKTGGAYIKELVEIGKLEEFDELGVSVDELDKAIRAKHTQILDYLFKPSMGMKVQWSESELVFLVLKRLTSERIPALSVFDSFIVRKSDASYVAQVLGDISNNRMDEYLFK